jgi:hypothetical protein
MPAGLVVESRAARIPAAEPVELVILSPPPGTALAGRSVTFSGTGAPLSDIIIRDWLMSVARCTADEQGRWSATVSDLSSGTHVFVAESIDRHHTPATSAAWTIHVPSQKELDAIAARQKKSGKRGLRRLLWRNRQPDGPTLQDAPPLSSMAEPASAGKSEPPDQGLPCILYPKNGSRVGGTLTVFGTSAANSVIAILDDTDLVGLAESDDTGYWTATVNDLSPGAHTLHARGSEDGIDWRLTSPSVAVTVREPV